MDDLVKWLRAQLDEDERIAREASEYAEAEWHLNDIGDTILCFAPEPRVAENERRAGLPVTADQWRGITIDHANIVPHVARHDPARVLREIEAKRLIIGMYADALAERETVRARIREVIHKEPDEFGRLHRDESELIETARRLLPAVRLLALPYADRPGYREEWRP